MRAGSDKETASETLRRVMKELEADGLERVTGPAGTAVREGGIGAVPVRLEQARPYRLTVVADDATILRACSCEVRPVFRPVAGPASSCPSACSPGCSAGCSSVSSAGVVLSVVMA